MALALTAFASKAEAVDVGANLPGATLGGVNVLGPSTATVTGAVNPNSIPGTQFYVEYRGPDGVLSRTPIQVAAGLNPEDVAIVLSNLVPGARYDARLVAVNPLSGLRSESALTTFTTRMLSVSGGTGNSAAAGAPGSVTCTKLGTPRRDVLRGTRGRDVICALGGNDRINGLGGNDVIAADAGRDRVAGGKGRDRMFGGAGRDRLAGRDRARDRINGGKGRDRGTADRRDRVTGVERLRRR